MNIILNPKNIKFMNHKNPETGKQFNQDDHIEFIKAEYLQSILYAPDKVVISLKKFINSPNEQNFIEVAKEMRISLWNKKSKLSKSSLKI
jgi:hypothetical protein